MTGRGRNNPFVEEIRESRGASTESFASDNAETDAGTVRNPQAEEGNNSIGSSQERSFAQAEMQSLRNQDMGDVHNNDEAMSIPECERRGEGDEPQVLEPSNPLMVRFQNSLKELLLRQQTKLQEEIAGLINEIKIQERDREELGERLYDLQEEIALIHNQTESCNAVISELCESRNKMEADLKTAKQIYKEKCQELENAKLLENKLRADLLANSNMLTQLKACEDEMESEMAVSQCISDKTKKTKREMCEAKKKQDWLLMKLRRAVVSLARERDELLARTEAKNNEKEALNCSLVEASTDLQILQSEQTRLTQAWNRVVVAIQQRDAVYCKVNVELAKVKDSFQLLLAEIETTHKSNRAEMMSNENIVGIQNRLEKDYHDLELSYRKNQLKMEDLEVQYVSVAKILTASEEDLACFQMQKKDLQTRTGIVTKELESVNQQKKDIEMKILDLLQEQGRHDRVFQALKQKLITMKDNTKKQELVYVITENQISKYMVSIEELRGMVDQSKQEYEKLKAQDECQCRHLYEIEALLKKRNNEASRKERTIYKLRQKMEALKVTAGVGENIYPEAAKMKIVQSELDDVLHKIEEKQAVWLRFQSDIVRLSSDRQEQLKEMDLQYKQSQILKQRGLKLESEISGVQDEQKAAQRDLDSVYAQLRLKSLSLFNQRENIEQLSTNTATMICEIEKKLKAAERQNLEDAQELDDMRQVNNQLILEVHDKKRERLNWEKKIELALESKQQSKESQTTTGEIGGMKLEIHRMKIRLAQLRKIQEALVKDLEQCIARREAISYGAEAREKRSSASQVTNSSRLVHERKIANFINKTKEAELEIQTLQDRLNSTLPETESTLEKQIEEARSRNTEVEKCICEIERQIEEGQILKLQNLDEIVRRQNKAKMYAKVKEGKHCLQFQTESRLQHEYCRQMNLNHSLQETVDCLMNDFPQYLPYLRRVRKTLQINS